MYVQVIDEQIEVVPEVRPEGIVIWKRSPCGAIYFSGRASPFGSTFFCILQDIGREERIPRAKQLGVPFSQIKVSIKEPPLWLVVIACMMQERIAKGCDWSAVSKVIERAIARLQELELAPSPDRTDGDYSDYRDAARLSNLYRLLEQEHARKLSGQPKRPHRPT